MKLSEKQFEELYVGMLILNNQGNVGYICSLNEIKFHERGSYDKHITLLWYPEFHKTGFLWNSNWTNDDKDLIILEPCKYDAQ